jgi:signal transduction histidine kinase
VHQLLDLAKPRDMLRTDVSIQVVVNATLSLLEETLNLKNIRVHKDLQATDDVCLADEEQLKQAFLNLFLNAVQAMDENGVLTILTTTQDPRPMTKKDIRDQKPDISAPATNLRSSVPNLRSSFVPSVIITIKDTGIGISKETLAQLFTPFKTTKKDGIGLGLVITKEIIEAHNGTITVESRLDEGTTFIIQLPLKA